MMTPEIAAAVMAEREAIAKMCDAHADINSKNDYDDGVVCAAEDLAIAIRARLAPVEPAGNSGAGAADDGFAERVKAFYQFAGRRRMMRTGDPLQDLTDFVLSEIALAEAQS